MLPKVLQTKLVCLRTLFRNWMVSRSNGYVGQQGHYTFCYWHCVGNSTSTFPHSTFTSSPATANSSQTTEAAEIPALKLFLNQPESQMAEANITNHLNGTMQRELTDESALKNKNLNGNLNCALFFKENQSAIGTMTTNSSGSFFLDAYNLLFHSSNNATTAPDIENKSSTNVAHHHTSPNNRTTRSTIGMRKSFFINNAESLAISHEI